MAHAFRSLAAALDRWAGEGTIAITETRETIVANQATGHQAIEVLRLLDEVPWTGVDFADDGGEFERRDLVADSSGIRVRIRKPPAPTDVEAIFTLTAWAASLERPVEAQRLWLLQLSRPFQSLSVRYGCWGDTQSFAPAPPLPSPRRVVRTLDDEASLPEDLGRWVKTSGDELLLADDRCYSIWKSRSAIALSTSLANEVERDGRLLFRGPPATRFKLAGADTVGAAAFGDLQRAASWVYESDRELENRHALMAAEIARTSLRDSEVPNLCASTGSALDSAKIAYNFGVTQQSRDTLKALSDLRKAVSDETTKLADTTRTLATAIAGAVFGNIGLIVARLTLAPNNVFVPTASVVLGIVLAIYVGAVIASGRHFLSLQRDLRRAWREKLYRFLNESEYQEMVERPARRAERGFVTAAWIGAAMCGLLLVAVVLVAMTPNGGGNLPPRSP